MLPFHFKFKSKHKRIAKAILGSSLLLASIFTSLGPAIIPATAQDAQNTDLFTGQFIPAYLGAAYDPSEAYKQMAGLPVYVFAYDTKDKVVGRAYKTQIRADGSFQAASLPNASHYGVCMVASGGSLSPFRPPIPEDNLNVVFAFNSGPWGGATPLDQNNEPASDINGCLAFYTSNRTVDIGNHNNIFPLVPTTVLSVIIKDAVQQGVFDLYNSNTPYEIYAQRITINSVPSTSCTVRNKTCYQQNQSVKNTIVNGPIIRGRSAPIIAKGGSYQGATIFQAYAPKGVYAITFWRPDTRDATATTTYINFNGSQDLNTPYNGIAFENVVQNGDSVQISGNEGDPTTPNQWRLAERDFIKYDNFAWTVKPGNLNIWGMTTTGADGAKTPIGGGNISLGNEWFGFVDPMNRTCSNKKPSGTISAWGIYLFSSTCTLAAGILPSTNTEITLKGYKSPYPSSSLPNETFFQGIDNKLVEASGSQGPTRLDLPLLSQPKEGVEFDLKYGGGRGLGPTSQTFNLTVDGKTYKNVATTTSDGKIIIPGIYFADKPQAKYTIWSSSHKKGFSLRSTPDFSFVIDGASLRTPSLVLNNLGTIDVSPHQSPLSTLLASLDFSNIFEKTHIPKVLAASTSGSDMELNDVKIFLDLDVINAINEEDGFFTYQNYDLTKVEMDLPPEVAKGNSEDYVIFNRFNNNDSLKNGLLTSDSGDQADAQSAPVDGTNPRIVGVELKLKSGTDTSLQEAYSNYQAYTDSDNPQPMPLTLKVEFRKPVNVDTSTKGQDVSSILPDILYAEVPVSIQQTDGPGKYSYSYDLVPLSVRAPGCDYGGSKLISSIPIVGGAVDGATHPADTFKGVVCDVTNGVVSLVQKAINFVANNLTTIDPLQYSITSNLWNIMRNLVNGMAVILLLIAGIAIMLRYEPTRFNLQSTLTSLVITIILVNFSILILQLAIDVANVISSGGYYFIINALQTDGLSGYSQAGVLAGMAGLSAYVFAAAATMPGGIVIAVIIGLLALFLGLAYVIIKAVWFWILRQLILIICIATAPVALAARVLPGSQPYYTKWRSMISKTLVSQIMFAFVLALAMAMLRGSLHGGGTFIESLATFAIAIGLFYYSTKFPAQAMAALGEAPAIGGLIANLTKKTAGLGKGVRTQFDREHMTKRAAENEGEKKMRAELKMKQRGALSRAARFTRQTTSLLGKSDAELEEARHKAEEAGARSTARAFRTEGEDPIYRIAEAIEASGDIQRRTPGLTTEQIKTEALRRAKIYRDSPQFKDIREKQKHASEARQEAELEGVIDGETKKIADSLVSPLIPLRLSPAKAELFDKMGNDPHAATDQLYGLTEADIRAAAGSFADTRLADLANIISNGIGPDGLSKPQLLMNFFEANKEAINSFFRDEFYWSEANIQRGDSRKYFRAFVLDQLANVTDPGASNKHRSMINMIERGEWDGNNPAVIGAAGGGTPAPAAGLIPHVVPGLTAPATLPSGSNIIRYNQVIADLTSLTSAGTLASGIVPPSVPTAIAALQAELRASFGYT